MKNTGTFSVYDLHGGATYSTINTVYESRLLMWSAFVFQGGDELSKLRYNLVSFSGGKDSTAMLLGMIERKMPIDCILFSDTGLEFPDMYDHINKVAERENITITRIKYKFSFEYLLIDHRMKCRNCNKIKQGFSWPGIRTRWCTSRLKNLPRERFLRPLREKYEVYEYVGIAADELYRLDRKTNQNPYHIHPLIEWGMTESDCLKYCYECGYDWNGLYEHFHRVSCWCCPLQSIAELRELYKHYPELWEKLKEWDSRTWREFRFDYNVQQLEQRFIYENERLSNGLSITGRDFYREMRSRINGGITNAKNS